MIGFFLKRPVTLFSVYAIIAVLGIASLKKIPIELLPDVEYPGISITISWEGASPEAVEKNITIPVEEIAEKLPGIRHVESISERGYSRVNIEFGTNTDMDYVKVLLTGMLSMIDLPEGSSSPNIVENVPEEFKRGVPFVISVSGPYSIDKISEVAERIGEKLSRVKGVKKARVYGGVKRVLNIRVKNPLYTPYKIYSTLKKSDLPAGKVEMNGRLLSIEIKTSFSPDKFFVDGIPIKKIADVWWDYRSPEILSRVNGEPEITINIEKRKDAGLLDTSRNLRREIKKLNLPEGMNVKLTHDDAEEIRKAIVQVLLLGIIGMFGVSIIFVITMRGLYPASVFFLTMVFSSLLDIILMFFSGLSLNILTLSGIMLGFGLVVDNSIIVMENILRLKEEKIEEPEKKGAGLVLLPVLASTLTTISVFLPFLFFQESSRVYYVPFALSSSYTLLSSVFVSFTLTPFLSKRIKPTFTYRPSGYMRILKGFIRRPLVPLIIWIILTGTGIYVFTNFVYKGEVWGFQEKNRLYVYIKLPSGSRRIETVSVAEKFEEEIKKSRVRCNFYTRIYPRYSFIEVDLENGGNGGFELKEKLENLAVRFANCRIVIYGLGPFFFTGSSGRTGLPELTIKGYDYYKLKQVAKRVEKKLYENPRIRNVDINFSWYGKQKEYVLMPGDMMPLYGISPYRGAEMLRENIKFLYPYRGRMELVHIFRDTLQTIEQLLSRVVSEGIQAGDIIDVKVDTTPGRIKRYDQEYTRDIAYEFRGPFKMAYEYKKAFLKAVELPEGFSISSYSFIPQQGILKKKEIVITILLALFLLMLILSSLYESYGKPLLILAILPITFAGVSYLYSISGINFETGAFVGLILLLGIAVNDGIVLIDHLSKGKRTLDDVVLRSGHRFRPIIITTLTTLAGFLPFTIIKTELPILSRLTLTCLGGLIFSTTGTLFILPGLYYLFLVVLKKNVKKNPGSVINK